ncbi:MAG: AMMECR1 domain-containing protein [Candidatus Binatia bacterium]
MGAKITKCLLLVTAILTAWISSPHAGDKTLESFRRLRSDPRAKTQLAAIAEAALRLAQGEAASLPSDLLPVFEKPLPIFITVETGGRVRGCMGSIKPMTNSLAEEIIATMRRALYQDPRHRPVTDGEIPQLKVYVTAVGRPQAVRRLNQLSPSRDGALLRSGDKEAIALPGEAKTLRYLLAFLKAKAGVKQGDPYQLYRLPSVTIPVSRIFLITPEDPLSHRSVNNPLNRDHKAIK